MNEFFTNMTNQFKNTWKGLNHRQRLTYGMVLGVFVLGLTAIILFSARIQYEPLYSEISEQEAGRITEELQRRGVSYKLNTSSRGTDVLVPLQHQAQLRVELAASDIAPSGGYAGNKLLDDLNITQTREDKEINRRRALEGEIARTLKTMEGVEDVRVHLTIPERHIFEDAEQTVRASIVLTTAGHADFTPDQITSMVKVIAYAVPGLDPANVAITDTRNRIIKPEGEDEGSMIGLKNRQLELEKALVRGYENGVSRILGQILGTEKVTVRVTVDMDFDQVEKDITRLSKPGFEQLLESQQTLVEKFSGIGFRPGGVPGTESNIPTYEAAENMPVNYERSEDRRNFLVDTEHTTQVQSPYIKRLTATVNVDGTYDFDRDEQGNIIERSYVARTAEQMANIEAMVKAALGYDASRLDMISITNIQFDRTTQFIEEDLRLAGEAEKKRYTFFGLTAVVAFILGILLLIELKTYLDLRDAQVARQREMDGLAALVPVAETGLIAELSLDEKKKMELRRRAEKAARDDPEMVANLIRTWLLEED